MQITTRAALATVAISALVAAPSPLAQSERPLAHRRGPVAGYGRLSLRS